MAGSETGQDFKHRTADNGRNRQAWVTPTVMISLEDFPKASITVQA
jgi:hypothetical protein